MQAPGINPRKLALARGLERCGAHDLLLAAQARWLGAHVRAINYHSVPPSQARAFAAQLAFLADRFVPVGYKELRDLQDGHWPHARPGILLSFDDGCRSHAEVVAPLLESHGLTGWFFVPSRFPDVPVEEQASYAAAHDIGTHTEGDGPRRALTWDQVRSLDQRHVVGCHTGHHVRLRAGVDPERLREEIVGGKRRLEEALGHPVDAFAWVGGEEASYSAEAARLVAEAGFRFAFMTNHAPFRAKGDPLQIQRSNVEGGHPLELLRFQISGVMDLLYLPKRRRVNRLTRTRAPLPPPA